MKHTSGPWELSPDAVPKGHTQITVYAESNGERVATVFREEANARLISAAPELLATLQEFVADIRANTVEATAKEWPDLCITYRKALEAIDKATR